MSERNALAEKAGMEHDVDVNIGSMPADALCLAARIFWTNFSSNIGHVKKWSMRKADGAAPCHDH